MTQPLGSQVFLARLRTLVIAAAVAGASLIGATTPAHAVAPDCTTVTPGWTASAGVYQVTTADQLYCIPDESLSDTYVVANTLNLSSIPWRPIGNSSAPFTGSFNGGDYLITGLSIQGAQGDYLGLFGKVSDANTSDTNFPTLSNIHLGDVNINATEIGTSFNKYVGGIAGMTSGATITNVTIDGTSLISAQGKFIGGVVGKAFNSVLDEIDVTATVQSSGTRNHGEMGIQIGGVIGDFAGIPSLPGLRAAALTDASFTGQIIGYKYLGGLIGSADPDGGWQERSVVVSRVTSAGSISITPSHQGTSATIFGGIIGIMFDTSVSDSSTSMSISGNATSVGGAFGKFRHAAVTTTTASGDITTTGVGSSCMAGGFVGELDGLYSPNNDPTPGSEITSSTATGDVSCNMNDVGGFVGNVQSVVRLADNRASGDVTNTTATAGRGRTGGFVGFVGDDVDIIRSSASGNVTASGANNLGTGGFAGYLDYWDVVLRNTFASGTVTSAGTGAGGLVGYIVRATGSNASHVIEKSYARGAVTAVTSSDAGGLVGGANSGSGGFTVTDSFWNTEDAGNQVSFAAGTQVATAAEMKQASLYSTAGWDIADGWTAGHVWGICTGGNSGYPFVTGTVTSSYCSGGSGGSSSGGGSNAGGGSNSGGSGSGSSSEGGTGTSGSTTSTSSGTTGGGTTGLVDATTSALPVKLPARIKNKGWTALIKTPVNLSTGQQAVVRITGAPLAKGLAPVGDVRDFKVTRKGKVKGVWLSGRRGYSITVRITAPAQAGAAAFNQVATYQTRAVG